MHNKALNYRPDIDGLRAIAVLAVLIFHLNPEWMPSGFIGVDIFFVISGYLITGIIYRQIDKGEFSLLEFFSRRVRRIIPASIFVIFITLLVGALFFLPNDLKQLSGSALASVFSSANIYFWLFLDTSYFADSSETIPLLHMWSLGVEEQFYLIWPLLLIAVYKLNKNFLPHVIVILMGLSFWLSQSTVKIDQLFSYYMLPTRAGELLLGCMTFMLLERYLSSKPRWVCEVLSLVGVGMIFYSMIYIDASQFPGVMALIPTVGACFLILSGALGHSAIKKVLSCRPLVAVGLVSFSLYLWHWPVLAFYRYAYGNLNFYGLVGCVLTIVIMTLFSYFFIEKPFRSPAKKQKFVKPILVSSVVVFISAFSFLIINYDGYLQWLSPNNYKKQLVEHFVQTKQASKYKYNCQISEHAPELLVNDRCVLGGEKGAPKIFVIGDSNAAHYVGLLKVVSEKKDFFVRNYTHSSCPPFPDDLSVKYTRGAARQRSCVNYNLAVRNNLADYDIIFVAASWSKRPDENYMAVVEHSIKELASTGKNIIVGLKVPIFPAYDRNCIQKSIKIPYMNCQKRSAYFSSDDLKINNYIKNIAKKYRNVKILDIRSFICPNNVCSAYLDGRPIYYDSEHLSMIGSEQIGLKMIQNDDSMLSVFEKW